MVVVVVIYEWKTPVNTKTIDDINTLMEDGCEVGDHWQLEPEKKISDRGQVTEKPRYKDEYWLNKKGHRREAR